MLSIVTFYFAVAFQTTSNLLNSLYVSKVTMTQKISIMNQISYCRQEIIVTQDSYTGISLKHHIKLSSISQFLYLDDITVANAQKI